MCCPELMESLRRGNTSTEHSLELETRSQPSGLHILPTNATQSTVLKLREILVGARGFEPQPPHPRRY